MRERIWNRGVTENFIRVFGECIFNNVDDEQHQKDKNRKQNDVQRQRAVINEHAEKWIQRESDKSDVVQHQNFAEFVAVKPHQKLVNEKKNKK